MARPTFTQMELLEQIAEMDARTDPPIGFPPLVTAMCLLPGVKPTLPKVRPVEEHRVLSRSHNGWTATWTAGINPKDGSNVGLPYGPKGRLLLAFLGGYAVRHKTPMIELGPSQSGFMKELGLAASGGRTGSKTLVGEQVRRLVRAQLVVERDFDDDPRYLTDEGAGMRIARSWKVWWDRSGENPTHPVEGSYIELSKDFYDEIIDHSFPLNLDALRIFGDSALAMDLYAWLTYRLRQLTKPVTLTWEQLTAQFGKNGLPDVGAPNRARSRAVAENKRNILAQLPTVLAVYHQAKVEETKFGLELRPSPPHVPERGMHGLRRAQAAASLPARRTAAAAADEASPVPSQPDRCQRSTR
ncbi:replication protein RepA [Couchioplanes caeruleus]|uniref:RepA protein n=2 Tax=Couchioplanes caeruleus TaxID=56438 RepID=A0A1K0GTB5_9ACTN|nr:replication protein RepA [Couchioplanes caeruleus]OJF14492.1 hypothetical protein BG844_09645 [Couchioplanes caeruleus subsp. caeruleus]ROP21277.1 RepA protein [Couchioplanes caeruleus]